MGLIGRAEPAAIRWVQPETRFDRQHGPLGPLLDADSWVACKAPVGASRRSKTAGSRRQLGAIGCMPRRARSRPRRPLTREGPGARSAPAWPRSLPCRSHQASLEPLYAPLGASTALLGTRSDRIPAAILRATGAGFLPPFPLPRRLAMANHLQVRARIEQTVASDSWKMPPNKSHAYPLMLCHACTLHLYCTHARCTHSLTHHTLERMHVLIR